MISCGVLLAGREDNEASDCCRTGEAGIEAKAFGIVCAIETGYCAGWVGDGLRVAFGRVSHAGVDELNAGLPLAGQDDEGIFEAEIGAVDAYGVARRPCEQRRGFIVGLAIVPGS